MLRRAFKAFNEVSLWRIPVTLRGRCFVPHSFDRLAALLLSKALPGDSQFRTWLDRNCKPGDVVLDIGANQGLFSIAASDVVGPRGAVHAFEPDPALAHCLRQNLQRNKITNVRVHEFALGSETGRLQFYRNPFNGGDNRLASESQDYAGPLGEVAVKTLDSLIEVDSFSLVKIDVQGWELAVLKGMSNKLGRNPNAKILLEFWPYGMRIAGFEPSELLHFLVERGYVLTEQGAPQAITRDRIQSFVAKIRGKKYTDLEAARPC